MPRFDVDIRRGKSIIKPKLGSASAIQFIRLLITDTSELKLSYFIHNMFAPPSLSVPISHNPPT